MHSFFEDTCSDTRPSERLQIVRLLPEDKACAFIICYHIFAKSQDQFIPARYDKQCLNCPKWPGVPNDIVHVPQRFLPSQVRCRVAER